MRCRQSVGLVYKMKVTVDYEDDTQYACNETVERI